MFFNYHVSRVFLIYISLVLHFWDISCYLSIPLIPHIHFSSNALIAIGIYLVTCDVTNLLVKTTAHFRSVCIYPFVW